MKKLLLCVLFIVLLVCIPTDCFAGDIPEALLEYDSSLVFFGEIKELNAESITVIQRQNIKGDFSEGRCLTYTEHMFTEFPSVGELYLCGYLDDNNPLYIWEVTSQETKNLQIANTDDMSLRMQEYLNAGKFEEKEEERLMKQSVKDDSASFSVVAVTSVPIYARRTMSDFSLIIIGVGIISAFCLGLFIKSKQDEI